MIINNPRSEAAPSARRTVAVLAACHGLGISAAVVSVTISALAANSIGMSGGWTTVAYGIQFLAALLTSLPASMLMERFGRKPVFLASAGFGILSGVVGAFAVGTESFLLLCAAHALLGVNLANVNFYRFAALEVAPPEHRASAMSLVLFGGTFAAVVGPLVVRSSGLVLPGTAFQSAYLGIAILSLVILALLSTVALPRGSAPRTHVRQGSLPVASLTESRVMIGLLAGALGYGAMNLLMIGCSIAMSGHGMAFDTISTAIQLHVLAMYVPSLVMGSLIERFGAMRIVTVGALLVTLAAIAALGLSHANGFFTSLILLGLGWNAMYLGGSAIVASSASSTHTFRLQGVNDLLVGIAAMLGAFLPGWLFQSIGWSGMNWLIVTLTLGFAVLIPMIAMLKSDGSRTRKTVA